MTKVVCRGVCIVRTRSESRKRNRQETRNLWWGSRDVPRKVVRQVYGWGFPTNGVTPHTLRHIFLCTYFLQRFLRSNIYSFPKGGKVFLHKCSDSMHYTRHFRIHIFDKDSHDQHIHLFLTQQRNFLTQVF